MKIQKADNPMELNAVFEGGGVRGIAHVGALNRMEERGFSFSNVAGTSAGSMVAGLYAAGFTSEEMKNLLISTDFSEFLSKPRWKLYELVKRWGIYDSDKIYTWIYTCLHKKGIIKFTDLKKNLIIRAANVTDKCYLDINKESHPNMEVAEAITMSAAIPFFFKPRIIGNGYIVDGGILSNYPLSIFANSPLPTIGFKLVSKEDDSPNQKPNNLVSFVLALIDMMRRSHDKFQDENQNSGMTIHINCYDFSATDFSLTDEQKRQLFLSGRDAATRFLEQSEKMLYAEIPPGHLGKAEIKLSKALVQALKELAEAKDYQSILRIGPAISRTLYLEGMLQAREEIGGIVENAAMWLDKPGERAQALIDDIGWSMVTRHEKDLGEKKIREGITIAKQSNEYYWAAKGCRHLAGLALQRDNLEDARKNLKDALEVAQKIQDLRQKDEMEAGIYYGLSEVEIRAGNFSEAEKMVIKIDELYEELRDNDRRVKVYALKGKIASSRSQWAEAKDHFRLGIRECTKLGRTDELIRNLDGLAKVARHEGDEDSAMEHEREAQNLRNQLPLPF